MKSLFYLFALAVCVGVKNVQSSPVATPGLAYPWVNWLAVRPVPPALALLAAQTQLAQAQLAAQTPVSAPSASDETPDANLLARSILPAPPSKKSKAPKTEDDDATTTKKPKLIDVGDFWAPPTIAPNVTSPEVIDPAFWAAKKTMFISKLFAALAKQVLNSTGTLTTTTPSPNVALMKEIDTVLLSDVARSVLGDGPAGLPLGPAEAKTAKKAAKKESAKLKKKAAKVKGPPPFVLAAKAKAAAATATTAAPVAEEEATSTPHPTLDYSSLAKALLS